MKNVGLILEGLIDLSPAKKVSSFPNLWPHSGPVGHCSNVSYSDWDGVDPVRIIQDDLAGKELKAFCTHIAKFQKCLVTAIIIHRSKWATWYNSETAWFETPDTKIFSLNPISSLPRSMTVKTADKDLYCSFLVIDVGIPNVDSSTSIKRFLFPSWPWIETSPISLSLKNVR